MRDLVRKLREMKLFKVFGAIDLPDEKRDGDDEEVLNRLTQKQRENAARIRLLEIQASPRGVPRDG